MGKSLLILGNGFDLAHGLPTTYSDFLEFSKRFNQIFTGAYLINPEHISYKDYFEHEIKYWEEGNFFVKRKLKNLFENRTVDVKRLMYKDVEEVVTVKEDIFNVCRKCYINNIWYLYFLRLHSSNKMRGDNWIDFEMEISKVIQWIECNYTGLDMRTEELLRKMNNNSNILVFNKVVNDIGKKTNTLEKFLNDLYLDLQRLTRALGIYLDNIVNKINIPKLDLFDNLFPDFIISFNYTDTYERLYCHQIPVCYIHGKCNNSSNNMVLGIAEYLDIKQRNNSTDMAIFKKFIQRIRKKNDTIYQRWHEKIFEYYKFASKKKPFDMYSKIYVFGHSLDTSDKDILELFLAQDFSDIELFAKDEVNEGKLLSNLLKIIGEDNIIEKSNAYPSRLTLKSTQNT
jgi:hypothetical protein